MKGRCLLHNFISCCIAPDLRVSNIKMFISTTNKNGEFAGHMQMKQETNSLISVQHSKWTRSANNSALLLSTFRYPQKNQAPPSDSLFHPSPPRPQFKIFYPSL